MDKSQHHKDAVQSQPMQANTKADKCTTNPSKKLAVDTTIERKVSRLTKQFIMDVDLALSRDHRCVRRAIGDLISHPECECRTFAYMDIICAMNDNFQDKCKEIEKSRLPADSPSRFKPCANLWNPSEEKEDTAEPGTSQEKEPKRKRSKNSSQLIDLKMRWQQMDTMVEPPAVKIVVPGCRSNMTVLRIG